MQLQQLHRWNVSYKRARALQTELRERLRVRPLAFGRIRFVAGADMAISKRLDKAVAAIVVYSFPDLELVETRYAAAKLSFPYIPGLLSFREIPVLSRCLRRVRTDFDVLICDGQGIAHPRGLGLASHLGLLLDKPTIGCAKSRLVGEHGPVGERRGDYQPLLYEGRRVGSVLRTQDGINPVFASPGHLVDHAGARRLILACAPKYRLPEPTRIADREAGVRKRQLEASG